MAIPNDVSYCWKGIIKSAMNQNNNDICPSHCFTMAIGRGNKMRFWDEVWIDQILLKHQFPRIYGLAISKSSLVEDFVEWSSRSWHWSIKLRRRLFDWEINQWDELMSCLQKVSLQKNKDDKLIWKWDEKGMFSVKFYKMVCNTNDSAIPPLEAQVWK